MGTADVAGAVRGRALVRRRVGRATARRLAGLGLAAAVDELAESPYGRYVRRGQTLEQAQAATVNTLLWHLRVLTGWQSRAAAGPLRLLGGAFELANIDSLLYRMDGGSSGGEPFELGTLAVAWPRLAETASRSCLRTALARSAWGDPGADDAWTLTVLPRLRWLHRVAVRVPAAAPWTCGAALLLCRRTSTPADCGPVTRSRGSVRP